MRFGSAADAGFAPERLEQAWEVLRRSTGTASVPAAVAAVGRGGVAVEPRAFGWAVYDPPAERVPAAVDTLFDLASLTKVVGTATAAWRLIERGSLRLGLRLEEVLEGFGTPAPGEAPDWRRRVTVRHLLTHTSGLPAGFDLRRVAGGREQRLAAARRVPLAAPPGERMVYSDIGFILLAAAVEEVAGMPLDAFCQAEIFGPLGMRDTGWNPPAAAVARTAATEWAEDRGPQPAGYLRGVVHDENARSLGGVAGHAGLFATVGDLARFADMLRAGGLGGAPTGGAPIRILSAAAVARMTAPAVVREDDCRTLGWQGAGRQGAPCGDLWTKRVFGHTGFTGTCLWIDPGHDLWAVLLTNGVHMGRALGLAAMPALRAGFHNALVAAVDGPAAG